MVNKKEVLSDCAPERAFWACNGTVIRNLHELANVIEGMRESSFLYHVNNDRKKNDFAKWIRDVFGDGDLASMLTGIHDRERYVEIIRRRLAQLDEEYYRERSPNPGSSTYVSH